MDDRYTYATAPVRIGPHELKHRVILSAHGVAWGGSNMPYDRQRRYYTERAKGGVSLVHVGATGVSRRHTFGDLPATPSDPRAIDLYAPFVDDVHGYGAKLFVELAEGGVHDRGRKGDGTWGTVYGVSPIPSVVSNESPVVLDAGMLAEIREDYVTAAVNLLEAGVDGINLHTAHSYLLGQFMSPAYNTRTDQYGGSTANNLRFVTEIIDSIRDAVGDRLAVGIRLSYDEFLGEHGITPDLSDEYVAILADRGGLDFYDISAGGYHTGERYVPPQVLPWAPIASYAKRARDIVAGRGVVLMAHRVNTVARADQLIADGVADIIGIARGHMADAELVNKTLDGREKEINLCVGSNECVYNSHLGMGLACTVNPAAGREAEWGIGTLKSVDLSRRVVVVGAGPAGMKAAHTAARRGHRVTLMEKTDGPGGSLQVLGMLPKHSQWNALTDQLVSQMELAGVDLQYGAEATTESIMALQPDAVVIATGSRWDRHGLSPANPGRPGVVGADTSDIVYTVDEAVRRHLEVPGILGDRIVIMDNTGAYLPLGAAELFTEGAFQGAQVTIISPRHMVGEIPKETWELPMWWKRVGTRNITAIPYHVVHSIDGTTVTYRDYQDTTYTSIEGVTALVIAGIRYAERSLFDELSDRIADVHLIGDALAPRRPADAVYDGERIGRML